MQRRPAVLAAVAVAVMLVLAIPLSRLQFGSSDQGHDPASTTTRQAYDLLAQGFGPGFNGPLVLVAQASSRPTRPRSTRWKRACRTWRTSPASPRTRPRPV